MTQLTQFNPGATYTTVVDCDGDIFIIQNGLYYDRQGNVFSTLPPSRNGYAAVTPLSTSSQVNVAVPAAVQAMYAGIPSENVAASIVYENNLFTLMTNGISSRYVSTGSGIGGRQLVTQISDASGQLGVGAWFYDVLIPGNLMNANDRLTLDFALRTNVAIGAASIVIGLFGDGVDSPSAPTVASPTFSTVTPTTGTSLEYSLTFDSAGAMNLWFSNGASAALPSTFSAASGPLNKLINLGYDFHIKIGFIFTGSTTGRTMNPYFCKTAVINGVAFKDPLVTYRMLVSAPYGSSPPTQKFPTAYGVNTFIQPFSDSSPWNTPIGSAATYDTSSLRWANLISQNPCGVSNGAYPWAQGFQAGQQLVVYQSSVSDPICNVTYTNRVQGNYWPMSTGSLYGPGSFQIRCKASALIPYQINDIIAAVLSPDGRWLMELGSYSYNPTTNTHVGGVCRFTDLYGPGIPFGSVFGNTDPNKPNYPESYRAAGVATIAGTVYGYELASGSINHALTMQLSQYQQQAAVFAVITATPGTSTIVLGPTFPGTATAINYSILFPSGTSVYLNGNAYTTTGTPSYSSNQTTLTLTTTISTTASLLYLGGATTAAQQLTQYVWPAGACDSFSVQNSNNMSYQGLVPLGSLIAIPQSTNLSSIGLVTAEGMALATAFQKYGGYNVDTAGTTFAMSQLGCDVTSSQVSNIATDLVAIRNALGIVTNSAVNTVGGGGTPIITGPKPLLRI